MKNPAFLSLSTTMQTECTLTANSFLNQKKSEAIIEHSGSFES